MNKLPAFLSLPVRRRSSLLTGEGGRWARSQIIRRLESRVLYKSFNTLCSLFFVNQRCITYYKHCNPIVLTLMIQLFSILSNVLSSTYFLGKTFFFSKIFLGDPPFNFLEVCLKFRSLERWSEKFDFDIARSPKKRFSADVELRSIVPNFVMSKNSMMQMCSG